MLEQGGGWGESWGRKVRGGGGQGPWGGGQEAPQDLGQTRGLPLLPVKPYPSRMGTEQEDARHPLWACLPPQDTQQGDGSRHRILQKSRGSGTSQVGCCSW